MKKKGIALISIVVVVLIISIVTGTITVNAYNTIKKTELIDFSKEIKRVQDFFNEYVNSNNGQIPVKGSVQVNISGKESAFAGEEINNSTVTLAKIDIDKIGLNSLQRGNLKTPDDVYLYSEITRKVYYPKGVQGYYTLTKELYDKLGIKDITMQATTYNAQDGIVIKSDKNLNNWMNNLGTFEVKVPKHSQIRPNVVSTDSQAATVVEKGLQNGEYIFAVTPTLPLRNFNLKIDYVDSKGEAKSYIYNIDKIDTTKPVLNNLEMTKTKEGDKVIYTVNNVNPVDTESGIFKLKYTNRKVSLENAKEYFETEGENVKNGRFTVPSYGDQNITIYCEDRAGNYNVYYMQKEKIYKPGEPAVNGELTPIKWVSKDQNSPKQEDEQVTTFTDKDWYNYDEKKWPNAKTKYGDYFVWIPRFEYKITYYTDNTKTQVSPSKTIYCKVDANLISTEKVVPTPGYKIHPAFRDGSKTGFKNGEWDREIPGFWFAKFEAARPYTSEINRPFVFRPNIRLKENKSIEDSYNNSFNYLRDLESHMAKNSEWGAVCILGYSNKYGIGDRALNSSSTSSTGQDFHYQTARGTTGNIYGVFDLTTMTTEYVSAYVDMDRDFANKYGPSLVKEGKSTKYVTVYPYNKEVNTSQANYEEYIKSGIYGDGISEFTIKMGSEGTVDKKYSYYPAMRQPQTNIPTAFPEQFFIRGGQSQQNASQFTSTKDAGMRDEENYPDSVMTPQPHSYRVVLIP